MKKKGWLLLLLLFVILSACQREEQPNPSAQQELKKDETTITEKKESQTSSPHKKIDEFPKDVGKTGNLNIGDKIAIDGGKYTIEVQSVRREKDLAGQSALVVSYTFTNNSSETVRPLSVSRIEVLQGEESLNMAIFKDNINGENSSKEVEPQRSIANCEEGFNLHSDQELKIMISSVTEEDGVRSIIKIPVPSK